MQKKLLMQKKITSGCNSALQSSQLCLQAYLVSHIIHTLSLFVFVFDFMLEFINFSVRIHISFVHLTTLLASIPGVYLSFIIYFYLCQIFVFLSNFVFMFVNSFPITYMHICIWQLCLVAYQLSYLSFIIQSLRGIQPLWVGRRFSSYYVIAEMKVRPFCWTFHKGGVISLLLI